jgi:hypothetical protein
MVTVAAAAAGGARGPVQPRKGRGRVAAEQPSVLQRGAAPGTWGCGPGGRPSGPERSLSGGRSTGGRWRKPAGVGGTAGSESAFGCGEEGPRTPSSSEWVSEGETNRAAAARPGRLGVRERIRRGNKAPKRVKLAGRATQLVARDPGRTGTSFAEPRGDAAAGMGVHSRRGSPAIVPLKHGCSWKVGSAGPAERRQSRRRGRRGNRR